MFCKQHLRIHRDFAKTMHVARKMYIYLSFGKSVMIWCTDRASSLEGVDHAFVLPFYKKNFCYKSRGGSSNIIHSVFSSNMARILNLNLYFKYVKAGDLVPDKEYQVIKIKKSINSFGVNVVLLLKDTGRFYLPSIMIDELLDAEGEQLLFLSRLVEKEKLYFKISEQAQFVIKE